MPEEKKSIWNIQFGSVTDIDIMLFTKHLAVILKSGLTLVEGLEILSDRANGKFKSVVTTIHDDIKAGESFHGALTKQKKHFTEIYINMVRSGETSGNLEENLQKISKELKKTLDLKKKIRSALIYPSFVFLAVFGLGMSVAIFVLPKILPLFRTLDIDLPATTKGLLWVAEKFENSGTSIFLSMVIGFSLFMWLIRRDFVKPFTHSVYLKIPVVKNIIKNINLERFNYTFGGLLESGLTVDQSLKITAEATDNRVYRKAIQATIPEIESGNSLQSALEKYPDIFPTITTRMVGVGEKTGNLDNTLQYLATFYEEEVDEATKNLSTVIEPILLMVIGIVVGTVAISILGPIYEISGNLG
ncbi:type II secretion system F family protein [Candidatus Gracilibacteria bacterium]|nr:type II secretion system F family protein [Candidatus Gracilibacteria bacterium]